VEAFRCYSAAAAAATVVVLRIRPAKEHRSYSLAAAEVAAAEVAAAEVAAAEVAAAEVAAAIVRPVAVGSSGIHFRCPGSTRETRRLAPSSAERS
jgi:adenosylmethionine-8-amino-7-oxononanoate aminotransferase